APSFAPLPYAKGGFLRSNVSAPLLQILIFVLRAPPSKTSPRPQPPPSAALHSPASSPSTAPSPLHPRPESTHTARRACPPALALPRFPARPGPPPPKTRPRAIFAPPQSPSVAPSPPSTPQKRRGPPPRHLCLPPAATK